MSDAIFVSALILARLTIFSLSSSCVGAIFTTSPIPSDDTAIYSLEHLKVLGRCEQCERIAPDCVFHFSLGHLKLQIFVSSLLDIPPIRLRQCSCRSVLVWSTSRPLSFSCTFWDTQSTSDFGETCESLGPERVFEYRTELIFCSMIAGCSLVTAVWLSNAFVVFLCLGSQGVSVWRDR